MAGKGADSAPVPTLRPPLPLPPPSNPPFPRTHASYKTGEDAFWRFRSGRKHTLPLEPSFAPSSTSTAFMLDEITSRDLVIWV